MRQVSLLQRATAYATHPPNHPFPLSIPYNCSTTRYATSPIRIQARKWKAYSDTSPRYTSAESDRPLGSSIAAQGQLAMNWQHTSETRVWALVPITGVSSALLNP